MSDILGVNEVKGVITDLIEKLGGPCGKEWLCALKKFLRKENPWGKHTVNLAKSPRLPFDGAEVVKHNTEFNGKSVVELELRSDDNLYIDGKKVVPHLSERQMGDKRIVGHELRTELEGGEMVLLNSNVLDYLYEHPELFPEHWKKDENGEIRFIFFWGSIFQHPFDGPLCIRYLSWFDGALERHYHWFGSDWGRQCSAASVASVVEQSSLRDRQVDPRN